MNRRDYILSLGKELGMNIASVKFASFVTGDGDGNQKDSVPVRNEAIASNPFRKDRIGRRSRVSSSVPSTTGHTRSTLKCIVTKWMHIRKQDRPPKGIALVGNDSFSNDFADLIGEANVTDIYEIEDSLIFESIFEAICEREANIAYSERKNGYLENILHIKEHGFCVNGSLRTNNLLSWEIDFGKRTGKSWTELLCAVFTLPRLDALATLANILGIQFVNMYQFSSDPHVAESRGGLSPSNDIPECLHLRRLSGTPTYAEQAGRVDILGNAGQVIGAIVCYRLGSKEFCLPAIVGRGVLCIGKYKPTAHFLNQHLMDRYPAAPVLFCQDMRTALALQRLLEETRGYTPDEAIITAHLGSDLSVLPWNYLHNHRVMFLLAPTKRCMAMVKLYKDQVEGAGARCFSICTKWLLHSRPCCDPSHGVDSLTDAEAELLRGAVVLDDVERPLSMVKQLVNEAIPYDAYLEWGQKVGIFKVSKGVGVKSPAVHCRALPPDDPAMVPARASQLADVTLYHTMRPGNYVVLLGAKGAGKTQTALSICRSLFNGNITWPLFRGAEIDPGNIAYVDAETPYDEYCANLQQHALAEEQGSRFWGLSRFAPDLPAFCNTFSLMDSAFREGLAEFLLENKCRFVFLDNLSALMGDGVHQGKAAEGLLDWVKRLQGHGLCVVLVHHKSSGDDATHHGVKARGSHLFTTLARTAIVLVGSAEILNNSLGTDEVQKVAAHDDGLTVGIRFDASKAAPVLEKKTLWLHLPLGGSEWEFLAITGADGREIELPSALSVATTETRAQGNVPSFESTGSESTGFALSPDEGKVLKYIQEKTSAQTSDVCALLHCRDTKARGVLQRLESVGLLESFGQGRGAGYRLALKQS